MSKADIATNVAGCKIVYAIEVVIIDRINNPETTLILIPLLVGRKATLQSYLYQFPLYKERIGNNGKETILK
ncbi:hypothetical protein GO684_03540 [Wolbachia endosymbiont of Litomosoides brasiliensis]|uniref:hypothetical protein n=1 Tax=Wolbachia endosymbiont of Litomosoides brasiliensis TaxID=1812117 RepID=UPI00158C285B|nr:hypothetical protein [Wolbachia endosymbiont of Litomosoides brasiliensis]NUY39721.1 hypothetical protein [Wolbachia endosymbiont of Litomosoides brasiliensis]